MGLYGTDTPIDALAIRDTSAHNSNIVFLGEFRLKTVIIENGLNQAVTLQCQGSMHSDFSHSFDVGSSFNVPASTNSYQTCDSYFPYMRVTATCASSPTTGTLTTHFVEYGGV